ncbi:BTB/POZ domain-containing protein 9 isoform X2 [Ischnura elegans]|nr:BTB/POZ domain-containing protein 9 isoform X2 [Ischnura elegans]
MSSHHHHLGTQTPLGEIDHVHHLSEHIGALYLNDEYSDVVLLVEGHRFHGHKAILAARSEYFRALLFGGLRESQQTEIELKGTSVVAVKSLLKYIYTGHMSLVNQKEDVILDMLGLAHQYGFVDLEASISDHLREALQIRNVGAIYDAARLYQLDGLTQMCCTFFDKHAEAIIEHPSFLQLSPGALKEICSRDSFFAPEVQIFRAVCNWVKHNIDARAEEETTNLLQVGCEGSVEDDSDEEEARLLAKKEALSVVRLPLISLSELLKEVRQSGLISPDAILDAIDEQTGKDTDLKYRGHLLPGKNVATVRLGAKVLQGEMRSALLDGNCVNYDMEIGYTRHTIADTGAAADATCGEPGILIELGMPCIINHISMLLWDRDVRSYSYYIEVSMDHKEWFRVIDHTGYHCRSWQTLYFAPRVVKYIRIVGTYNTVNKVFHVVSMEASFNPVPVAIEKGLIVPKHNVARVECSASVIEGVSRSRNALLNGDTSNYDWETGYTCHQLGSGAILIQLSQPYLIDSMRLLLWDCDDRSYSYYIEVSVNSCDWELVADKTREVCRSWQTLRFKRRAVVFIRIVGTHNTANEVFHCVHFECPAQVDEPCCSSLLKPAVTSSPGKESVSTLKSSAARTVDEAGDKGEKNVAVLTPNQLRLAKAPDVTGGAAAEVASGHSRDRLSSQPSEMSGVPDACEGDHVRRDHRK